MKFYNWLLNNKKLSYNTTKIYWYWISSIGVENFEKTYNNIPTSAKKRIIFFAFKYYYEYLNKDMPDVEVSIPKRQKDIYSLSNKEHVSIQENFIDNNIYISINGKMIAELAFVYGMIIGEILNMKWEDIKDGVASIVEKGNKKRFVPMSEKYSNASSINEGYLINIKGKKISYSHAREILEKIKEQIGLDKRLTWHSFRHGCAIRMLNSGINIYALSNFLGHSNINTTTIYLKYETINLKKQMKKLGLLKVER